jgi:nucleoside-diphosphate-sugar epimerase
MSDGSSVGGKFVIHDYQGRHCLVTGGLGFIGSNLAIALVRLGAGVTIVDSYVPGCGANASNVRSIASCVEVIPRDVGKPDEFAAAIRRADIVFNLAGEISHSHGAVYPERDLAINTTAQLNFVTHCARQNPGIRVVYASTRQVYGRPNSLPVDETHPVQPIDFNGVHKEAASNYHLLLGRTGAIDPVVLRLSNVYGPRMALNATCQGFLCVYLRKALLAEPIEIYGDGLQIRDPAYIDDVVDAFLRAGIHPKPPHRLYNLGGTEQLTVERIAVICASLSAGSPVVRRSFPEDRKQIDIGSYYSNTALLQNDMGWHCKKTFDEGLAETMEFYRSQLCEYLDLTRAGRQCSWCDAVNEPLRRKRALAS